MTKQDVNRIYYDTTGDLKYIENGQLIVNDDFVIDWDMSSRNTMLTPATIKKYKSQLNWSEMCRLQIIPIELLETYIDYIDFKWISQYTELPLDFITRHMHDVDWEQISRWNKMLTIEFVKNHSDMIKWNHLFYNRNVRKLVNNELISKYIEEICTPFQFSVRHPILTYRILAEFVDEKFIDEHWDIVNKSAVCETFKLSTDFIKSHIDTVVGESLCIGGNVSLQWFEDFDNIDTIKSWGRLFKQVDVPLSFISKHFDKINKTELVACRRLPEDFLYAHQDELPWHVVCKCQPISTMFIVKTMDLCAEHWDTICMFQKLDESFIHVMRHELNWSIITEYQYLSEKFITKHRHYIDWDILVKQNRKWSDRFMRRFMNKFMCTSEKVWCDYYDKR